MSQFYARVFVQILDSSIAEDFTTRHVFEDFLKLCDRNGIVDMTRFAMSRRLNVPLDVLNACIGKLEAEDPQSRDPEFNGRRLERMDDHRDWGWRIVNWAKYDGIRTKADAAERVAKHRATHRATAEAFDAAGAVLGVTDQPEVVTAWQTWVQHRREIKHSLTPLTAKRQLNQLKELGPGRFIAAIETAITKGWIGLYEGHKGNGNGVAMSVKPVKGSVPNNKF